MMFAVASKTLQQITTARTVTTRSFAAASEKVWKVYLSGKYFLLALSSSYHFHRHVVDLAPEYNTAHSRFRYPQSSILSIVCICMCM
jgi:hypothetical protein